ncbi:hypothetical protein TNCV_1923791 [Trichonephila clavipes]|nr:hypothetical protein TNCV_1923791 [Trichonephila clavipes]
MTRSVAKSPRVAEQCGVNIHSLTRPRGLEPRTTEDPACRGGRCTLNMSRLKRPSVGGLWKLGEGVSAQVSSSSLDYGWWFEITRSVLKKPLNSGI